MVAKYAAMMNLKEVVTVDEMGTVRALGKGTAVIQATSHNGLYAECEMRNEFLYRC